MRRIMVAVDGYEPSLGAFKKAVELAGKYDAEVIALQVEEKTPQMPVEKHLETSKGAELICSNPLELAVRYAQQRGVQLQTVKTAGVVTGTILMTSQSMQIDLIVIGDSARRGLDKMHFGSVTESVLRGSVVPVLVVKKGSVDISDLKTLVEKVPFSGQPKHQDDTPTISLTMPGKTPRQRFALSFGFLAIFSVIYFVPAIINTDTFKETAGLLWMGFPLGLWLGFLVFPTSLIISSIYLRMGR